MYTYIIKACSTSIYYTYVQLGNSGCLIVYKVFHGFICLYTFLSLGTFSELNPL